MTGFCRHCGGKVKKDKGLAQSGKQRWTCVVCDKSSTMLVKKPEDAAINNVITPVKIKSTTKRFVITSVLNDCPLHKNTLEVLENYCNYNKAQLIIVPIAYRNTDAFHVNVKDPMYWPKECAKYFTRSRLDLNESITLGADLNINATRSTPCNGYESISKQRSLILAHPRVSMKMVATPKQQNPKMITTTGCISNATYTNSTAGNIAKHHHQVAALVVEIDGPRFWVRQLHFDKKGGVADLNKYYKKDSVESAEVAAVIFGDTHLKFLSAESKNIYKDMIKTLKPKHKVFHDLLDFYSGSHHHRNDPFLMALKSLKGDDCVKTELDQVVRFLDEMGGGVVVESNHHKHLLQWMQKYWHKDDPKNYLIYSELSNLMADCISKGNLCDPFELYLAKHCKARVDFTSPNAEKLIEGIDVSQHGDRGANGARGSLKGFSQSNFRSVVGHTHTPGIEGGCYMVGTSVRDLEYAKGLSSWAECHCVIYANGQRSLIFVIEGAWRG